MERPFVAPQAVPASMNDRAVPSLFTLLVTIEQPPDAIQQSDSLGGGSSGGQLTLRLLGSERIEAGLWNSSKIININKDLF
jgi:hypothetical protein